MLVLRLLITDATPPYSSPVGGFQSTLMKLLSAIKDDRRARLRHPRVSHGGAADVAPSTPPALLPFHPRLPRSPRRRRRRPRSRPSDRCSTRTRSTWLANGSYSV